MKLVWISVRSIWARRIWPVSFTKTFAMIERDVLLSEHFVQLQKKLAEDRRVLL